ncbi:MAG: hypothetical protein PHY54_00700 [Methylococcales bacterium]|nr:hypothetical protein [Methylococcales bacterium]
MRRKRRLRQLGLHLVIFAWSARNTPLGVFAGQSCFSGKHARLGGSLPSAITRPVLDRFPSWEIQWRDAMHEHRG